MYLIWREVVLWLIALICRIVCISLGKQEGVASLILVLSRISWLLQAARSPLYPVRAELASIRFSIVFRTR